MEESKGEKEGPLGTSTLGAVELPPDTGEIRALSWGEGQWSEGFESDSDSNVDVSGVVSSAISQAGISYSQDSLSTIGGCSGERKPKRRKIWQQSKSCRKKRTGAYDHLLNPKESIWEPPVSPYGLIEELVYWDPWKLLVSCILLNKTTGTQVRRVIWDLFRKYPSPTCLVEEEDDSVILDFIKPLGLGRKRTSILKKFSEEYLSDDWVDPITLHGVGNYAADAYFIFCRGQWRETEPEDKELKRYIDWLAESKGLGYGATRDPIPIPQDKQDPVAIPKDE